MYVSLGFCQFFFNSQILCGLTKTGWIGGLFIKNISRSKQRDMNIKVGNRLKNGEPFCYLFTQ